MSYQICKRCVMDNSSDDARLALRMLSTKAIRVDSTEALEKIEVRLGEMARVWAEVNMGSVNLNKLRGYKEKILNDPSSYKVEDAMYLALAFADFGSFDDAQEIYDIVKNEIKMQANKVFKLNPNCRKVTKYNVPCKNSTTGY